MSWTKLAVTGLTIMALLIIWMTFPIWAAAFLGVLFALSLVGPAEWICQRVRIPFWLSTSLLLLVLLATLAGLGWVIGPPLASQVDVLAKKLPVATQNVFTWLEQRRWGQRLLLSAEDWTGMSQQEMLQEVGDSLDPDSKPLVTLEEPPKADERAEEKAKPQAEPSSQGASPTFGVGQILLPIANALSLTVMTAALLAVSFVVMVFVAFDPLVYQRGVLWLVPSQHDAIARQTMQRLGVAMRWWMIGRLASMTVIGVLTSLGMWLIGMPAPIALGALAGLLSFVPNVGPIVASVPGLLLGLGEGSWMVLWALGVYIVVQLVESNAITPLVEQYAVSVPPGVMIVTQFIFAVLAGVWGMIVATPLLVVAMVLVQQLYVREGLHKPIKVTGSI